MFKLIKTASLLSKFNLPVLYCSLCVTVANDRVIKCTVFCEKEGVVFFHVMFQLAT